MTYQEFLKNFLDKGYSVETFSEKGPEPEGKLYLRHDVDFSIDFAYEMAAVETAMGVNATYFIRVDAPTYNIFSKTENRKLNWMQENGHIIGLHYVPEEFIKEGFSIKISFDLLSSAFHFPISKMFTVHQPLKRAEWKALSEYVKAEHSYLDVNISYYDNFPYFADSRGSFRFGSPLDSEVFFFKKSLHLNIHPIWWAGTSPFAEFTSRHGTNRLKHQIIQNIYRDLKENYNVSI